MYLWFHGVDTNKHASVKTVMSFVPQSMFIEDGSILC